MTDGHEKQAMVPMGVVIRKAPGVTRWAAWTWRAVAVLPGAPDASWQVLRREGDVVEYHAATVPLELHHTQTEAYLQGLSAKVPSIYVVMRDGDVSHRGGSHLEIVLATASPFEAQDYADTGEEIVEKLPMPGGLIAWVRDFVEAHHEHEDFKKRRRDTRTTGEAQDGIGDPRIPQMSDVYRAPMPDPTGRGSMSRGTDFWTRRRAQVEAEAQAQTRAAEVEAREADLAERTDAELCEDLGLPDPDAMQPGDDFSAFMSRAVPERLRRRALRRLWRSNPVLANVDGLVDYGEDFTDSATVIENLQTAYQVGRGMTAHVEELARQAEAEGAETEEPIPEDTPTEMVEAEDTAPETSDPHVWTHADQSDTGADLPTRRRMRFAFDETGVSA